MRFKNKMKNSFSGKYERELSFKWNIIGSFIPIWALLVSINLGWKYGTLSILSNMGILYGVIFLGAGLVETQNDVASIVGVVLVFSCFPLHGVIVWYFIKLHNNRVIENKKTQKKI